MEKIKHPFILSLAALLPQFDHTALHVRDLQKSSEFYAKVMRLEKNARAVQRRSTHLVSHRPSRPTTCDRGGNGCNGAPHRRSPCVPGLVVARVYDSPRSNAGELRQF